MRTIWERIIGAPAEFGFEHRMYHVTILFGALMSLLGAAFERASWAARLYWIFFAAVWLGFYYSSRSRGGYRWASSMSFVLLIFVFFPYSWFLSNGSYGVFTIYAVVFAAIMSMILKGKTRTVLAVSFIGVVLVLIGLDYRYDGLLTPYAHVMSLPDLAIHLSIVITVTAALISVYSNTFMNERARSEQYAKAIAESYDQQLYYMENLEQLIQQLKAERHDFNHHLGVVYGLLEGNDIGSARSYASHLVEVAEEYQNIVSVPYPVVRAMLNYKLSQAADKGIDLRLDVKLPDKLQIDVHDLTIVLGNLLDNAIDACLALEKDQRYIDLRLLFKPDYLVIQLENPVEPQGHQEPSPRQTSKKDAENHGFGLKNIEYIVSKHRGLMKVDRIERSFTVHIAMLVDKIRQ